MEWWRNSFWLYSVPSPHCLACPLLALSTKFEGVPKLRNGNQNQTRIHSTSLLKENNYVKGSVRELQILQQTRYLVTFRNTTAHRHPKFKKVHLSLDFPDLVTARKRSLGQGNVFTPVCQSFCSQWLPKRAVHPTGMRFY